MTSFRSPCERQLELDRRAVASEVGQLHSVSGYSQHNPLSIFQAAALQHMEV